MASRGPRTSVVAALIGCCVACAAGIVLLAGPTQQRAEGFSWSAPGASGTAVLHFGTRLGNVWLDEPVGERPAGRAAAGLDVRVRVRAAGPPLRTQLWVHLVGPTTGLYTSTTYLERTLRGGQALDRTVTLAVPGTYTLRVDPLLGPVTWSASVAGRGTLGEPAWRAGAPWSVASGVIAIILGVVCGILLLGERPRDRWIVVVLGLGAATVLVAAAARLLFGAGAVALPAWAAALAAAAMAGAAMTHMARGPVLPGRWKTWARARLGWAIEPADGALRGWRWVSVVIAVALLVVLGTTMAAPTGRRHVGGFDLEQVKRHGPATVTVLMDTRGAPLRVRASSPLGGDWGGEVGPDLALESFLTAGVGRADVRLLDPGGAVAWRQTLGPEQRAHLERTLTTPGRWRLEISTRDARGMYTSVHGSYLEPQPFIARDGAPFYLAWFALALLALTAAPIRRVGARIAGLALLPIGFAAALGLLVGAFEPTREAWLTVAGVLAVALTAGVVTGWSLPRDRSARRTARVLGSVIACIALAIALLALPGALDGIGFGAMRLMSMERYETAGAVFVLACATAVLWLGSLLLGLGTAPRRRRHLAVGRSAAPIPSAEGGRSDVSSLTR